MTLKVKEYFFQKCLKKEGFLSSLKLLVKNKTCRGISCPECICSLYDRDLLWFKKNLDYAFKGYCLGSNISFSSPFYKELLMEKMFQLGEKK